MCSCFFFFFFFFFWFLWVFWGGGGPRVYRCMGVGCEEEGVSLNEDACVFEGGCVGGCGCVWVRVRAGAYVCVCV